MAVATAAVAGFKAEYKKFQQGKQPRAKLALMMSCDTQSQGLAVVLVVKVGFRGCGSTTLLLLAQSRFPRPR